MKIKSLYRDYIQKSKLFLYPLLDIKRGVSVTPVETFMAWGDKYGFEDSKLICQYHMRDDQDFKLFNDVKLKGNHYFYAFHQVDDTTGIYVFDFSHIEDDFWKVVTGKYSELSKESKQKILSFFRGHTAHYAYIESYLKPDKYYGMYSEILNVKMVHFKKVKELCDKPDLEKEDLILSLKTMNVSNKPLHLQSKPNE